MTTNRSKANLNQKAKGPTLAPSMKAPPARSGLLKRWRGVLELSQRGAAEALGMSLRSYQELERGARFGTDEPMQADRRTMLAAAAVLAGVEPLRAGQLTAWKRRP